MGANASAAALALAIVLLAWPHIVRAPKTAASHDRSADLAAPSAPKPSPQVAPLVGRPFAPSVEMDVFAATPGGWVPLSAASDTGPGAVKEATKLRATFRLDLLHAIPAPELVQYFEGLIGCPSWMPYSR